MAVDGTALAILAPELAEPLGLRNHAACGCAGLVLSARAVWQS